MKKVTTGSTWLAALVIGALLMTAAGLRAAETPTILNTVGSLAASLDTVSSSGGEQIKWQVIASGGGRASSFGYKLDQTVGQTVVGLVTSINFKLNQGFWQEVSAGGCCVALTGNVDCDASDGVDVGDLTTLIDNLFITFTPLCCEGEANCDGAGGIDVSDLTALIDNLFINFTPLPGCQ